MPASGGSVTDNSVPTNKVVKGQEHYLAYITPDEGKSLVDQGGTEVITKEGIPAYPGHYGGSHSTSTNQGPAGGASTGGNYGGDSSGGYSDQERHAAQHHTPDDVADTASGYDHTPRTNIEDIHG